MIGDAREPAGAGATPPLAEGVRRVREPQSTGVPLHRHPDWERDQPWLVQGTTGRGDGEEPFDLGLWGDGPVGATLGRWRELRAALGIPAAVHALQVHGTRIHHHDTTPAEGLLVMEGLDGHITARPGLLLTVSVADCVPVFLVAPEERRVAMLHAGWRGTAAGMVPAGIQRLAAGRPETLLVHLGPAICGECYEVGPEVHEALGLERPAGNRPVDVRAVQARQAVAAGVPAERVSVSEHCTRCGTGFFSHRGGSAGRQMGVLGIR